MGGVPASSPASTEVTADSHQNATKEQAPTDGPVENHDANTTTHDQGATETQSFNVPKKPQPMSAQALAESKVDSQTKQTKISYVENGESKDSVTVNTGNTVQINFQTNDYEAGDKFTFKIHPKSTEGDIDITKISDSYPYNITPANDKPNQASVSEVQSNKNEYEFTDIMKGAGTYSQIIAIKTSDYFKADKVYKDGTYEIAIDVYKNDDIKPFTTSTFKQVIDHYQSVQWPYDHSSDSLHNIYTMDDQWVSNGTILPDTDYKWKLNIGINPFYNQETQVTIPVPDKFTLNQTETNTNSDNLKWLGNYHATISQNGNNLIINFPKLTDDQVKELKIDTYYATSSAQTLPFYIIGKIGQHPAETTTVSGNERIKMEYNLGNNQKTSSDYPLQAIILGTNNPVDNTPIGNLFSGNIGPDKYNKMHTYYPEQPEKITTKEDSEQGIHALNNNVSLSSTSAQVINDIDANVIVPDGMNISSIANEISSDSNPTFQYEYLDGTKSDTFTQDKILTAPNGKFIKNIHVHIDKANPYHQLFNIKLMGVLADEYRGDNDKTASKNSDHNQPAKGDKVSNLDTLTTKIAVTLSDSNTNPVHDPSDSTWSAEQIVLDKNPDTTIHLNKLGASGDQKNHQAGTKNSGTISITVHDFQDEVPNNIFYVVLPENAVLNADKPFTDLPKNATVDYLNIDGRNIVKIQLKGGKREDYAEKTFELNLDNSSVVTNKTLESNYHIYVAIPDGQKEYDYWDDTQTPITSSDVLPLVENNSNAYSLADGNWTLVTSVVTQTTTQSKGNQNSDFTSVGKSDDKGSADMSFSSSIVNGETSDLENITTILRMPNTSDGKSKFDFQLKNPIKVINVTDGNKEVTDGIQIFYTTETSYKIKAMKEISTSDWQNDFTSTVPTDLSKVTAVAVKIAKIPPQYLYRIVAEGIDPTLATDAGKTAYVANKIWSDSLLEKNVEVGKEATDKDQSVSAKISVSGQSTIHVKLHYKDANGTDQYIPVDDLTLKDNEDTLTKDAVLAVLKNSLGIDDDFLNKYNITKDNINDIEDFRKELIKKYPTLADYAIDFSNPSDPSADTQNENQHRYANDAPDKAAGWDQVAQYYFDGDQVIFETHKLQDVSQDINLQRQTTYVSTATGEVVKAATSEDNLGHNRIQISYDPLTNGYLINNLTGDLHYQNYTSPDDVADYTLVANDQTLTGPQTSDLKKIIKENSSQLFSSANTCGMQIDITKDGDGYTAMVKKDQNLQPRNISVVYHQVAHYNPIYKIDFDRDVHYVSVLDENTPLQDPTTYDHFKTDTLETNYDQNSHALTSVAKLNEQDFYNVLSVGHDFPSNIKGYAIDSHDNQLYGPGTDQLQNIITSHQEDIFNPTRKHGVKIVLTATKTDFGTTYEPTITEDSSLEAKTIRVFFSQTAHYAPSHANLITMVPGQNNELTAIANNIDQDGNANKDINFGVTDEQLAKTGYTYKVYYVPNSYEGQLNDAITNNDYEYLTTAWLNDNDSYDNLAAALVDHPEFDDAWDDGSDANEHNNGSAEFARLNSQNFVVVYTPINQRPQEVYITSDNDPFAYNNLLKDYAMPKAIVSDKALQQKLIDQIKQQMKDEDADQESLQHLLNLAEAGHFDYIYKMSGKAGQLPILSVEDIHSFNSYGTLPNTDISNPETGEVTPLYPHLDQNNSNMVDATIQTNLYTRNGHYIQQVTLSSADGSGKKIVLTHTFDPNKNPEQTDSDTTGDAALLQLLNYLTNQTPGDAGFSYQISNVDNGWKISVDGLPNSAVVTDEDGNKFININNADRFIYNDTDYNADQSSDPNPQIINFHYATISPENSEDQQNKVTIHYIDVTGVEPMDINQAKEDYGFNFAPGTKYSQQVNAGNELTDIPGYDDNRSGVVSAISKDFTFDNTAKDNEILKALADQGYYLVQRDRETTGQHPFDIYASDQSTGEYNGNYPAYYTGSSSEQNYYVYLKKGRKVNYQVILEDKNGQQMKVLTGSTLLGYGDPTDKIATTPIGQDHTVDTDTIGKKYDAIMEGLKKQYPNYTLVVTGNPNSKLTVSDEIGTDETFGDKDNDLTKTIYMVPKYGNVTVHYVDVDKAARQNPEKKEFESADGEEIADQRPASDKPYGTEYQNTPWHYEDEGYELATNSLPAEVTNGKVENNDNYDIYVFLKHKHSDLKTQPKTVHEIIKYVDQDGNPLPKDVKDTTTRQIIFTPHGYYDEQAKKDVITDWTSSGNVVDGGFDKESTEIKDSGYDLDEEATKNDPTNTVKSSEVLNSDKDVAQVPVTQDSNDVKITVHYKKKAETHIHYIDVNGSDKTSKFTEDDGSLIAGHDVDHVGHINDLIFPNDKNPWDYASDGWILAENPANVDKNMKLTKDTPHDVYVYLKHGTTDIENPKTIKVTETVHYIDENGKPVTDKNGNDLIQKNDQSITLTQTGKYDKATKENIPDGWSADHKNFSSLSINKPTGYDVDKVYHKDQDDKNVDDKDNDGKSIKEVSYDPTKVATNETQDQNVDVYVVLKKQAKTTVHYIDVEDVDKTAENLKPTDGKTIDNNEHNFTFNGHVGDDFSSNLWQYPDDWEFVTQSPEIKGHTLTNQIPSDLYVYLKHKHTPIKQTKTVNETINYVDQDGNPLPKNVKDTTKRTITFKTTDDSYHDEVTGDDHIVWTPEGDFTKNGDQIQFGTADTGAEGYDLDEAATKADKDNPEDVLNSKKDVGSITVDPSQELTDITRTIHYKKQAETHIHYIDVNDSDKTSGYKPEDGKVIDNNSHNVDHNGNINDPIFPNNETPWNFADAGWILAETPSTSVTKDMTLTKDTPKDIYVYLKHDTSTPLTKDATPIHVTETIHYVDEAGHPVADKNGNTTTKSTKTIALTPQGYFDKVANKNVVTGWTTPDGNQFPAFAIPEFDDFFAISANHTDQNNSKVDDFDKDNKQVKTVSFDAAKVPATTTSDQNIDVTVVLKKKHSDLQNNNPMTVTETVHYVDENGNPVKSDDKIEMTLTPEGYHDNQTNEDVITGWTSSLDNSEFPTHPTHVDGYDIDMTKTKASDVSDDHSEVKAVKVTVENNQQPANVEITIHYTKHVDPVVPDDGDNQQTPPPSDDGGKKTPEDKPQTPSTEKHEDGKTPSNKKHSNTPSHKNKNSKKTHTNKSSKTAPIAHEKNAKKSRDNKRWSQTAASHAQNLDANSKKNFSGSNLSPMSLNENANYTRAKKYNIGTNADKRQALPQTGEKANELGLLGLGLASLAALISLAGDKKRKN